MPKINPNDFVVGKPGQSSTLGKGAKGGLIATVGVIAAGLLMTFIPKEESGRTVKVEIKQTGDIAVQHVSGRQYLKAYLDIAGIPTACDGITKGVKIGQTYTEEQCGDLVERELVEHAHGVMACSSGLRAPGRDYQRVGAVMLGFNIGVGGWCGSTARKLLDAGNISKACDAFLRWDKAKVRGVLRPVKGLTMRRNRERQICLTGTPGYTSETLASRLRPYW